MALEFDELFGRMVGAGQQLAGDVWNRIELFALPELKKIAVQIIAIGKDVHVHGMEGAKLLLQMQLDASLGIIAGMTELTMIAVQKAINAILDAVADFVNTAIGIPLLG